MENIKILIVDDNETDCLLMKQSICNIKCLDCNQFQIDFVNDFVSANSKIIKDEYDLYLIDYRLGINDGIELIKKAREQGITKPMILITGHDNYETDIKAMETGADCYFSKKSIQSNNFQKVVRYSIYRNKKENFEVPDEYSKILYDALNFKF